MRHQLREDEYGQKHDMVVALGWGLEQKYLMSSGVVHGA